MRKLSTIRIITRKRTRRAHHPQTLLRVSVWIQSHTGIKLHQFCSQIFDVVHGAKEQRVIQIIRFSKTVQHDGHPKPFLDLLISKCFDVPMAPSNLYVAR